MSSLRKGYTPADYAKAYDNVMGYTGTNWILNDLKARLTYGRGAQRTLNSVETEYALKCIDFQLVAVKKVYTMMEKWAIDQMMLYNFLAPASKIYITAFTGEIDEWYTCDVIFFRAQTEPWHVWIPKWAFATPVHLEDTLYQLPELDFTPYDNCLRKINPDYFVMDHQKRSVEFLLRRGKCILSLEQGLGKSLSSIVASLEYGRLMGRPAKVLIICPASLKLNWRRELMTFVPERDITLIKSVQEMRRDELIDFLGLKKDTDLTAVRMREVANAKGKWDGSRQYTIINYEIAECFHHAPATRSNEAALKAMAESDLIRAAFDVLIIDEAHKLSNDSGWYKTIKSFVDMSGIKNVWMLTGTMVTNNPKNLYNVLSVIRHPAADDYEFYMRRYCDAKRQLLRGEWDKCWKRWKGKGSYATFEAMPMNMQTMFRDYVGKYGRHRMADNGAANLPELAERISDCYFRFTKAQIPGFVKKTVYTCPYQMSLEEWNQYDKLWEEYKAERLAEGKKADDELKPLLENSVCRKYISGLMVPRTVELANWVLSTGNKVFIACAYNDEVFELRDRFGDACVIFKGGMSEREKDAAVERFNNDDTCRVFIGNSRAAGVGLNLNKACHIVVFQNLDYTPSDFGQVCDRVHRLGSKEDVQVYVQYFEGTVYQKIWGIIERKQRVIREIIKD